MKAMSADLVHFSGAKKRKRWRVSEKEKRITVSRTPRYYIYNLQ